MSSNLYSSAALAYLGDCVIEGCVREHLVRSGISHSAELNAKALEFVRASAQAEAVKNILPVLTDEENTVFRRGRNIGHTNTPKSATPGQYRAATGMEALFGYLHLEKRNDRITELFALAYQDKIQN
ncbi:MAG: ribonuclease III [Clostridia bacterium]|nr:ribonuclease III [Clostridia bacterium]